MPPFSTRSNGAAYVVMRASAFDSRCIYRSRLSPTSFSCLWSPSRPASCLLCQAPLASALTVPRVAAPMLRLPPSGPLRWPLGSLSCLLHGTASSSAAEQPAAEVPGTSSDCSVADTVTALQTPPEITKTHVTLFGKRFPTDHQTNVTDTLLARTSRSLHRLESHPLRILTSRVRDHFTPHGYAFLDSLCPIVTKEQNFDELLVPADHVSRDRGQSYYLNDQYMLRAHSSAHQAQVIRDGLDRFLIAADVYRRDQITARHYPVFHQLEGVHLWDRSAVLKDAPEQTAGLKHQLRKMLTSKELSSTTIAAIANAGVPDDIDNPAQPDYHSEAETKAVVEHLKASLETMVESVFTQARKEVMTASGGSGEGILDPIVTRWVDAYFPFTAPSFEMEVWYQGRWVEVAGCGVIRQEIVNKAGQPNKLGWAFGIGLDRLAMPLFSIPDIRLFWITDQRFLDQFAGNRFARFQPLCKIYNARERDVSFWCPVDENGIPVLIDANDVFEVIRETAGDIVEDVRMVDEFFNKKTGKFSRCYRISYRSHERDVGFDEINTVQWAVRDRLAKVLNVQLREGEPVPK